MILQLPKATSGNHFHKLNSQASFSLLYAWKALLVVQFRNDDYDDEK